MGHAERWTTVEVEVDEGIAWVELNRPEKRNAMSPTLNVEMVEVLLELDADDDCGVLVLTGTGEGLRAASPTIMALATRLADHLDCDSDDYLAASA